MNKLAVNESCQERHCGLKWSPGVAFPVCNVSSVKVPYLFK